MYILKRGRRCLFRQNANKTVQNTFMLRAVWRATRKGSDFMKFWKLCKKWKNYSAVRPAAYCNNFRCVYIGWDWEDYYSRDIVRVEGFPLERPD